MSGAFFQKVEMIVLAFAFAKIGFATGCTQCGDGWGELAGVWGRGLVCHRVGRGLTEIW